MRESANDWDRAMEKALLGGGKRFSFPSGGAVGRSNWYVSLFQRA
jgi:hypothetical protein